MTTHHPDAPLLELVGAPVVAEIGSDFTLFGTLEPVTDHLLV